MRNNLILSWGFLSLTFFSVGFCEEAHTLADKSENLVVWEFKSKKSASKKEKEPEQTGNYNDITKKGGWAFAEFLYWQPSTAGLPIGLKSSTTDNGIAAFSALSSPREHHISYDFHPGFRVGLGCRLPYDHWDLYSQWTQIDTHGRKTISASTGKILSTIWEIGLTGTLTPSSIIAKGTLGLKVADLELGKVFYIGKPFALRPSIGARGTWIDQRMKMTYSNGSAVFLQPSNGFPTFLILSGNEYVHLKNQYTAGGLRGAMSANWNFKEGWALYGKTGLSLLWGRFKADGRSDFIGTVSGTTTPYANSYKQSNHFLALKSSFDITAGLSWTKVFSQKLRLSFNAGYEFNFWPNQQELKIYAQTPGSGAIPSTPPGSVQVFPETGDLGFQGFNIGGCIDF